MTEATTSCRREIELEIPAEEVQKSMEKIAREIARVARVPGFRPGKAPVTLIRRRFAEDIKSEVLQSLLPEHLERALAEKKLAPVTRPQVDHVEFPEAGPVKFRAVFEVFPEFELGEYKGLEVEVDAVEFTDDDVARALEEMRGRAATFVPVEGRTLADGDFGVLKIIGVPAAGGEPIQAENVLCHIGAEETMEAFNTHLRGAQPGDKKQFDATYPQDYPDPKLAGKTFHYTVDVLGVKERKLPELNDEFAKDVDAASLEDLRSKIRENLEAARDHRQREQAEQKIIEALIAKHEFPVPDALVEHQMDARLERVVRSLAGQGVDPRAVNVDWVSLRQRQRERAVGDVKAEMLLDRIASAESVDVAEEEIDHEIIHLAEHSGESAQAVRARLTKQGSLDRMKSKLRSDKTLEWLHRNARIRTAAKDTKS
ncbi:MAG: trigger factor [Acidobacteria bacterium]|nr:trigger factor [Acidobacteriota bacterium]MBI3662276.1 trigger factor [Acidobacteriota bacterium]